MLVGIIIVIVAAVVLAAVIVALRRRSSPDATAISTSATPEEPGTASFPDPQPELVEADEVDPLHHLAETLTASGTGAVVTTPDELPPLGSELRLTDDLVEALRERGVERSTMTASELTKSLLSLAGYTLRPGSSAGTYIASRAGTETYLAFVDHEIGSYPELSETAIESFLAGFYLSHASKGLLFSDKFSPYLVYEKERRDDRVRFITRQRLQTFVDSIAAL